MVKYIKSITNRYGEREHSFEVNGKVKTFCIPVGARQSVEGLYKMLLEQEKEKQATATYWEEIDGFYQWFEESHK